VARSPTSETAPHDTTMSARIRTLIVDDSAFARKTVREMLQVDPEIDVVGAARDGEEAMIMTDSLNPDVVVCDLNMPKLDGVGYVRRQMRARSVPILILSAAAQDAPVVIEALNAGAVDVVAKPSALASDDLRTVGTELITSLKAAVGARVKETVDPVAVRPSWPVSRQAKVEIVVIGISTGGPQALRRMIPMLTADFPVPIAIVLHMPVGYTALYAKSLDALCALTVKEAQDGEVLQAGTILVAQAGRHLGFRRTAAGEVVAHLTMQPLQKIHRPSADVLFRSAADLFGQHVLAVVMTGMGDDGKEGAAWVKAQGGSVLTEHEKSCVIYGMPRAVEEAGLSDASIPLDDMARAISTRL
jgi:two-component system chemotaxis response regulator CheB